jgi:hypothetical protein
MTQTSKSADDEKFADLTGRQALTEKVPRVKPKYKLAVLITVAVLTMAALIYVNLQNVRDTVPRVVSSASPSRTPVAGPWPNELDRTDRVDS